MSNNRIQIPPEFLQYYNRPAYFLTYYGDVYFGYLCECSGYSDRIYIVQNDKIKELQSLKRGEQLPDRYRKLGWEIKDPRIISNAISYNPNQRIGSNITFSSLARTGQNWKRMFVFGAGASTYCTYGDGSIALRNSRLKPPLGCDIFDEGYNDICRKYPAIPITIPQFNANGKDIEACLEEEWKHIKSSYNPKIIARHVNLQYYLHELCKIVSQEVVEKHFRNNLYSPFVNKLQKYLSINRDEQVALVSFNYDIILDQFIEQIFSIKFKSTTDYVNYVKNPFLYFKPHGSANWGWQFKHPAIIEQNGDLSQFLYSQTFDLASIYYSLLGNLKEMVVENSWGLELGLNKHQLGRFSLNKNGIQIVDHFENYYPGLLLPYRDKDEFVMPYDHHKAMRVFMDEMEELYLIGWKGNEDVFNRQLATYHHRLKKIIIVNPSEKNDQEVSRNLSPHLGELREKYEVIVFNDFEDFVINHLDDQLEG